jgi:hypothetical protein
MLNNELEDNHEVEQVLYLHAAQLKTEPLTYEKVEKTREYWNMRLILPIFK